MKRSYAIVLALFCFSLFSSTVDELNIFNQEIHDTGINTATVDEIESQMNNMVNVSTIESDESELNIFSVGKGLSKGIKIMFFAVGKTFVMYHTFLSYGVPESIAGMIQGMVTLVEGIALVEFMLNRRASQ